MTHMCLHVTYHPPEPLTSVKNSIMCYFYYTEKFSRAPENTLYLEGSGAPIHTKWRIIFTIRLLTLRCTC